MNNLNQDMLDTLQEFAASNGKQWRAKLRRLWTTNGDTSNANLRRLRNVIGPSGLSKIKVSH